MMSWFGYRRLRTDTFRTQAGYFVETLGHLEAISRLIRLVESGKQFVQFRSQAGLGKSMIVEEAVRSVDESLRRGL